MTGAAPPEPVAFTARTIDSDGVRLATRDYGGTGPALLLMHGAGMEQGSLEPLARQLQPHFRVVTFDFRGHGGSDRAPWTFAGAVQDVRAVAGAHGLGVPAVGGHSRGGTVAVAFAREHPECPAVVNIDGHGRGRVDQYPGYDETAVRQLWVQQDRKVHWLTGGAGAAVLKAGLTALGKPPTATPAALREILQDVGEADLFEQYRQLRCPLLVFNATRQEGRRAVKLLAGKGVPMVRAYRQGLRRDLAQLAADRPTVRVVELDAPHLLVRTHPELVARYIKDFLVPASDDQALAAG